MRVKDKEMKEVIIVITTVLYGSETWTLDAQEKGKVEMFEMSRLRNKWAT